MSDSETTPAAPAAERGAWLRNLRRVNEQQEDGLAPDYDAQWGKIEDTHRAFVERFLSMLPPDGRVLDAACGTGKYFPMVLASGRSLLGVDHSGAYLANARAKFSHVPTEKHDLQDLGHRDEPDGYYHYYPPMHQVRAWVADAGFALEEEVEGPWHEEEEDQYAYHHVLAHAEAPPG